MLVGLEGKIAVVTGASAGIGLAVTQALVNEGVHVVAGARNSTPELDVLVGSGPRAGCASRSCGGVPVPRNWCRSLLNMAVSTFS